MRPTYISCLVANLFLRGEGWQSYPIIMAWLRAEELWIFN
jgi:hypothetical protein